MICLYMTAVISGKHVPPGLAYRFGRAWHYILLCMNISLDVFTASAGSRSRLEKSFLPVRCQSLCDKTYTIYCALVYWISARIRTPVSDHNLARASLRPAVAT